jgi:carbon storage regulator CsrA
MLVLSRKVLEALTVGNTHGAGGALKVTVLEIRQDRVKLGFSMNDSIPIVRWELLNRGNPGVGAAATATSRADIRVSAAS